MVESEAASERIRVLREVRGDKVKTSNEEDSNDPMFIEEYRRHIETPKAHNPFKCRFCLRWN